jgi:3'(2'), 5'-bisphosphate nucleotidase
MPYEHLVEPLRDIAREAGRIIMNHYDGEVDVHIKEDESPVTTADLAANDYIVAEEDHQKHDAGITNHHGEDLKKTAFWLVDPLDGTTSFIKKTGQFTVNIGLVSKQKPILGVIYLPVQELLYYTGEDGKAYVKRSAKFGAKAERVEVRSAPAAGLTVISSRSNSTPETEAFIKTLKVNERINAASSLKLCRIAEGEADVYPRFGTTMEWDIAAGHAILNAAGGSLTNVEGKPFLYGKDDFRNPHFVAWGKK